MSGVCLTCDQSDMLRGGENLHDIFINLQDSMKMTAQFKKTKIVALMKHLPKKVVEKILEEH